MLPEIIRSKHSKFVFYKQHLTHPLKSHRAFKVIQWQVRYNNELLQIRKEIEIYGHPLIKGITSN